jgi:hypothetical protein
MRGSGTVRPPERNIEVRERSDTLAMGKVPSMSV